MTIKFKPSFDLFNDPNKFQLIEAILDIPNKNIHPLNDIGYSTVQTMNNNYIRLNHLLFHLFPYDENSNSIFQYFINKYENLKEDGKVLITPSAYIHDGSDEYNLFTDDNVDMLLPKLLNSLTENGFSIKTSELKNVKSIWGGISLQVDNNYPGYNGIILDVCYYSPVVVNY